MKYMNRMILITAIVFLFGWHLTGHTEKPKLTGPYLGQILPGGRAIVFAPGIISTEAEEFSSAFSPNGKEFYFTRSTTNPRTQKRFMTVMVSCLEENGWSTPEMASFCKEEFTEGEPNFSSDGKMVLFGRMATKKDGDMDPRVMISHKSKQGWNEPFDLMHGMMASITKNNMIYYTDITQGYKKGDLYRVQYHQGHIHEPEKLGPVINSEQQDAHPYVTPDGSMLFFDSNRPGGSGDNDLYVSFRQANGSWGKAVNMGPLVNSKGYDALPYLSYDGKYFFFSRNKDIYWIDTEFVNKLK